MKMLKLLDSDLERYSRWFKWAGWSALVGFYLVARFSDRLPWETWESRMAYALGGLAFFILLFSLFILDGDRIPFALLAVGMLGMELARVGDVSDPDDLRKSAVMAWSFTIAMALLYDGARLRKPRQEIPNREPSP